MDSYRICFIDGKIEAQRVKGFFQNHKTGSRGTAASWSQAMLQILYVALKHKQWGGAGGGGSNLKII